MNVAIVGDGQLAACLRTVVADVGHAIVDVPDAAVVWAAADTPVGANGLADVDAVRAPIVATFDRLAERSVLLVSSQVPPGFTGDLRTRFRQRRPNTPVGFAYCVENIKANAGPAAFLAQRGFVVGIQERDPQERIFLPTVQQLFAPFGRPVAYMSLRSAELCKTAINGLLASIIGYVNEIGELADAIGADPADVERGMRFDVRLGNCPLKPGAPFANEHLGRDLRYLMAAAAVVERPVPLIEEVYRRNSERLRIRS